MAPAPDPRWRQRSEGLHVEAVAGSTLAYDTDDHQVHCLGTTASAVWAACDEARTEAELAARTALPAEEVARAVTELGERGLLQADGAPAGMTRRRFGIAAAGVAGAALVWSIAAPTPAAAASDDPVDPPDDLFLAVANLQLYDFGNPTGPEVSLTIRNLSTSSTWSVAPGAMTVTITLSEPGSFDGSDPTGQSGSAGGMNETFYSVSATPTTATFRNTGYVDGGAFTLAPGEVLVNGGEVIDFWWGFGPPTNTVPARTGLITATISYTLVGDPTVRTDTRSIPWPIG